MENLVILPKFFGPSDIIQLMLIMRLGVWILVCRNRVCECVQINKKIIK